MVNKIIANYLAGGKRLVIPQFGAFIHKEGDGVVVFVPFLKKDDGVLVDLLRKEYGLDEADARGVITEYIAQIGSGIAERGSFAIEGVGRLKIDANGIFFLDHLPVPGGAAVPTPGAVTPATVSPVAPMPAPEPKAAAPVSPVASAAAVSPVAATPRTQESPAARDAVRDAYYGSGDATQGASRPVAAQGSSPMQGAGRPAQTAQPVQATQPVQQAQSQSYTQRPVSAQPDPAQSRQPIAPPQSQQQQAARPGQPQPQTPISVPPRPSGPGYGPQGQPPMGGQPTGRPPGRPMPPRPRPAKAAGGKSDKFMVIAILAAIVALASIVYGVMSSSDGPLIEPMEMPSRHTPAQDSVSQATEAAAGTAHQTR